MKTKGRLMMLKKQFVAIASITMLVLLVVPTTSAEILENHNCVVMGMTTNTWFDFDTPLFTALLAFYFFFVAYSQLFVLLFYFVFYLLWRIPVKRDVGVGFGLWTVDMLGGNYREYPARGWIKTVGDNGTIEFKGTFWGGLDTFGVFYNMFTEKGVTGFKGIRKPIIHPVTHLPVFFVGYAKHFRIDTVEE